MKPLIYIIALFLLFLGIFETARQAWLWYQWHTARLEMARSDYSYFYYRGRRRVK